MASGPKGRRFKSCHLDHISKALQDSRSAEMQGFFFVQRQTAAVAPYEPYEPFKSVYGGKMVVNGLQMVVIVQALF